MSGYWSFREVPKGSDRQGSKAPLFTGEPCPALVGALSALPTALEFNRSESDREDEACALKRCTHHAAESFLSDATVEIDPETEERAPGATLSPHDPSSLLADESGEVFAAAPQQLNEKEGAGCVPTANGDAGLEEVVRAVEQDWWRARLGVDIHPLDPACTAAASSTADRPASPGCRETHDPSFPELHHEQSPRSSCAADGEAAREEARQLLRGPTHRQQPPETGFHNRKGRVQQRRPTATVPRAPALRTARAAARREAVKEGASVDRQDTEAGSHASSSTAERLALPSLGSNQRQQVKNPRSPGVPTPTFVSRMEERAAARQAARTARLPKKETERAVTTEPELADPQPSAPASAAANGMENGGAVSGWVPAFFSSYADLIATVQRRYVEMVAHNSASSAAAVPKATRLATLRELRQELALVATHYAACRQAHAILGRWRMRARNKQVRRQHTAAQQAQWRNAVEQLSLEEAAERSHVIAQEERIGRSVFTTTFRREMAYQMVCRQHQQRERFLLRWYFVAWVSRVEGVRDERRASAYRAHLLRCAQLVLQDLQPADRSCDGSPSSGQL